jgi:hypothetical protein
VQFCIRRCLSVSVGTSSGGISRPFRVLGVQQIAIGSCDRGPLTRLWTEMLGLNSTESHRMEKENVEEDIIRLGHPPFAVEIDLMCPIDPDKSPKVRNIVLLWYSIFLPLSCIFAQLGFLQRLLAVVGSCSAIESHWFMD